MFYSKNFMYAGEVSEFYDLNIASVDSSGVATSPSTGTIEILEDWIYKREKPFFYGVRFTGKNQFPIQFFSPHEITAPDYSTIEMWLGNRQQYEDLSISQPDMDSFFFRAIFTDLQPMRIGNLIYGLQATCLTDSPFLYEYPRTLTYTYTDPAVSAQIIFYNLSHYRGYLYPTISFTMNSSGGNFSIVNVEDSNRAFTFTGMTALETVEVNCDLGIVDSSTGVPVLSKFNKNFFRLKPGVNTLNISGAISSLSITYQFLRRLGG